MTPIEARIEHVERATHFQSGRPRKRPSVTTWVEEVLILGFVSARPGKNGEPEPKAIVAGVGGRLRAVGLEEVRINRPAENGARNDTHPETA